MSVLTAAAVDVALSHIENAGAGKDVVTMTSPDPGAVRILTLAVHGETVIADALQHAVRRDLGRLIRVLGSPVTAVRRGALIEHICYLLDQFQAHHRILDEVRWPTVLAVRPELADVACRVANAHDELIGPMIGLRDASQMWRGDPRLRPDVCSAVRELLASLQPVLDQDSDLAPLLDEVLAAEPAGRTRPGVTTWAGSPTRLARRTFWLLDDLDPRQADLLTERTPRAVMWILRNGFSGAYNRSAYLMWVGGGTGQAI